MRVLHCAALLSPPSGIRMQMQWDELAASKLCISWKVKLFCPRPECEGSSIAQYSSWVEVVKGGIFRKVFAWLALWIEYNIWLYSVRKDYDAFILRYNVHDPFQLLFIFLCRRPVYLVHHTLEEPELAMGGGLAGWIRSKLESLIGRYAIKASAGTIGVTKEIINYERRRAGLDRRKDFLYPNGVYYRSETLSDRRGDALELLFVASSFAPWHGLDLLLNELSSTIHPFVLHIVGDVCNDDRNRASNDDRVVFHGHLNQEDIRKIAEKCSLGLSSFALDRNGMKEACTLKVREYLLMGLPVYAGHSEVFPQSFKFYRNGPVSFVGIIDFARTVKSASRQQVSDAARPYIDKVIMLDSLYRSLVGDNDVDRHAGG